MKRRLARAAVALSFAMAFVSSCGDENNRNLGGRGYFPCAGKSCGVECRLCAPDDAGCVESQGKKYCDSRGGCLETAPSCAAPAYDPCAGKPCGAHCTTCSPDNPNCLEPAIVKSCDVGGRCLPGSTSCQ